MFSLLFKISMRIVLIIAVLVAIPAIIGSCAPEPVLSHFV